MANWTLDELGRDIVDIKQNKQDKESYLVWKRQQDEWRRAHEEKHTWLIRAIGLVAMSTIGQLVFLFINLLTESGG